MISAVLAIVVAAQEPSFVPGEVIVKFTEGAQTRTRGDAFEALSRELGIPVRATETTAGSEVVLSIDADRLGASLTEKLEADERVESVEIRTTEPKYILEPPETHFIVKLANPRTSADQEFVEALEKDLGAPLKRIDSRGDLILALDIPKLTLALVEKLKARPDVVYAQTNDVLQRH